MGEFRVIEGAKGSVGPSRPGHDLPSDLSFPFQFGSSAVIAPVPLGPSLSFLRRQQSLAPLPGRRGPKGGGI